MREKSMSIYQALRINCWAYKLWWKEYPQILIAIVSHALLSSVIPYLSIYYVARIVEKVSQADNYIVLKNDLLFFLLITMVLSGISAVTKRWKNSLYQCLYHKKRKIFDEKLLEMDYILADDAETSNIYSQIMQNDIWSGYGIQLILDETEELVSALTKIVCAISLSLTLFTFRVPSNSGNLVILNHPAFVASVLVLMLIIVFITPVIKNRAEEYWVKYAENAAFGNRVFDFFGELTRDEYRRIDVRMYRQDRMCRKKIEENSSFYPGSPIARAAKGPMGALIVISEGLSHVLMGLIYVFVCLKAKGGAFGIGMVTQYIGALTGLVIGLSESLRVLGEMKINGTFLFEVEKFLKAPNNMYQGSLTVEKRSDNRYEIEFVNVDFCYPGAEEFALKNINVKFKIGEKIAIVGKNGSGKTTFIKLLCRLVDPTYGTILMNGIDIRKYNYKEYMSIFSVVFQDYGLMAFSVAENIRAGKDYEKERMEQCLRKVGLTEWMEKQENGLETCISKEYDAQGIEISGGEAQKLAIARALYKAASFLILDEPTAALDPVAEYEIYTNLNQLVNNKTAVYISHRLASCKFCDEILVFDKGEIIQRGSHKKLIQENSKLYYQLWNAQSQYYKS